jgi:hypothetical protein
MILALSIGIFYEKLAVTFFNLIIGRKNIDEIMGFQL